MVTPEEFDYWRASDITKALFKKLEAEREEIKENLVYNAYENADVVKGMCIAIKNLINIEYEDLFEIKEPS
jgi:hypothetical protein